MASREPKAGNKKGLVNRHDFRSSGSRWRRSCRFNLRPPLSVSGKLAPFALVGLLALVLSLLSPALAQAVGGGGDIVEYPGGATPDSGETGEIIDLSVPVLNVGTEALDDIWLKLDIHAPNCTKVENTRTEYPDPETQQLGLLFLDGQGSGLPPGAQAYYSAKYSLGISVTDHFYFAGNYTLRYRAWKGQPGAAGAEPIGDIQEQTLAIGPVSAPNMSVPILMYHRVDDVALDEYWVSRDEFEAQMKALVAYGYQAVTTEDIYDYNYSGGSLPPRPVVLTFDDGYQNVYTHAYPILMQEGLFGEFYIVTDVTVFSDLYRKSSHWIKGGILGNPHMTWPEIIEMAANGMVIGSHSKSHRDLTTLTDSELDDEILGSKQELFSQAGITTASFAYPYGAGDDHARIHQRLAKFDYTIAVSAWRGICQTQNTNPLDFKRVYVYGPHLPTDPDSSGVSVNYDPAHPDDFFMSKLDPTFPVPEITVESVEFLDEFGASTPGGKFYPGERMIIKVSARNDGAGADVALSLRLDIDGGIKPLVYNSRWTVPSEDIRRYFPPTTGSTETFEFLWEIPPDAAAGSYDYEIKFRDQAYVLGYALGEWVNDSFVVCDNIHLLWPSDGALIQDPPTFYWDAGCANIFVVDFSFDPGFNAGIRTTPILSTSSFAIPPSVWNRVPLYRRIYWRVRGADTNIAPLSVITSEEVWSFWKY